MILILEVTIDETVSILHLRNTDPSFQFFKLSPVVYSIEEINDSLPSCIAKRIDEPKSKTTLQFRCKKKIVLKCDKNSFVKFITRIHKY